MSGPLTTKGSIISFTTCSNFAVFIFFIRKGLPTRCISELLKISLLCSIYKVIQDLLGVAVSTKHGGINESFCKNSLSHLACFPLNLLLHDKFIRPEGFMSKPFSGMKCKEPTDRSLMPDFHSGGFPRPKGPPASRPQPCRYCSVLLCLFSQRWNTFKSVSSFTLLINSWPT